MKKNFTIRLLGFLAIPFLLPGCKDDEPTTPITCEGIEWTHNGSDNGQDEWVDLCQANSACGGTVQSPVNITGTVDGSSLDSLGFNYHETPVEIENKGYTMEFVCEAGSSLNIGGKNYTLKQFHYHTQSEHQLNGAHFPLEVHFVHKASDTDFAVVGVFFEEGAENELFTEYLSHFPPMKEETYHSSEEIDLAHLLPTNKSFYHYEGSLTTPPCSEVVHWYVLKNKITASASQLAQFQSILQNNYRQLQSLNGRPIYSHDQ